MKKLLLFFLGLLCFISYSFAQNRQIRGKIIDESGNPVPNVNVTVQGSTTGVQTDADGNFAITTATTGNVTVRLSSTGYEAQSITTDGKQSVTVTLIKSVSTLDDVVVVGYQTMRKKDLTGSISSVTARDLKDIPITSAAQALAGRLAGVQVTATEGSPDAEILIRVRGGNTITQDAQPIYVVDGVQVENALSVISLQDIQSVDVLKDAATTAIYGARGANGVIIITTKGGRNTRPTINYTGFLGVKKLANKLEVMRPYDFVMYQYERSRGSLADSTSFANTYGRFEDLDLYNYIPFVDWQEEMFGRQALWQTHNVSLNGGNVTTQYNLSLTSNAEEGVMLGSDYDRKLVNFKFDHTFSPRVKVGFTTRYNNTLVKGAGSSDPGSAGNNRLRHSIKYRPILMNGDDLFDYDPAYDALTSGNGLNLKNPVLLNEAEYRRMTSNTANFTGYVNFTLNKYVSFRTTFGYELLSERRKEFDDTITAKANSPQGAGYPVAALISRNRTTINNSNVLTFTFDKSGTAFSEKNKITLLAGQEIYQIKQESANQTSYFMPKGIEPGKAFANMGLFNVPAGLSQVKPVNNDVLIKTLSFFGRLNYSFDDRYLLTLSVRGDASPSKFSKDNRWAYFPSGTFAWRISNERFFEGARHLFSDLKLRAGYGKAGNNRIGDFLYLSVFSTSQQYGLGNTTVPAFNSTALANNALVWEENISRNIGIDASILNNRFQVSLDYYNNTANNLLMSAAVPQSTGYSTQIQNIGSLTNKGFEFQLSTSVMQKRDFSWTANFNISYNKNTVNRLNRFADTIRINSGWAGGNAPSDYLLIKGHSIGDIYGLVTDGWYGVSDFTFDAGTGTYTLKAGIPSNSSITSVSPRPGTIRFKDVNGDGVVNDQDRTIIGNATPKFIGGLNQEFTYKNFGLTVFINFQFGNDILNANKLEFTSGYTTNTNMLTIMNDRWRYVDANGNRVTDPASLEKLNANAKIWAPLTSQASFYAHSWGVEDGSFIRLNNVTLSYTLPSAIANKLKIQRARFYVTGNNLKVFTNYSGYDPEVSTRRASATAEVTRGVDYSAYPRSRNFIFGLNLTF